MHLSGSIFTLLCSQDKISKNINNIPFGGEKELVLRNLITVIKIVWIIGHALFAFIEAVGGQQQIGPTLKVNTCNSLNSFMGPFRCCYC